MIWLLLLLAGVRELPRPTERVASRPELRRELVLAHDAVILLDGKLSKVEDFPPDVEITRIDVSRDGTITRIEARTKQ